MHQNLTPTMMNKEMQVCNLNGVQGDKVSKILNHKHQEVVENGGSNSSSHDGNNTFTKVKMLIINHRTFF